MNSIKCFIISSVVRKCSTVDLLYIILDGHYFLENKCNILIIWFFYLVTQQRCKSRILTPHGTHRGCWGSNRRRLREVIEHRKYSYDKILCQKYVFIHLSLYVQLDSTNQVSSVQHLLCHCCLTPGLSSFRSTMTGVKRFTSRMSSSVRDTWCANIRQPNKPCTSE